MRPLPRLTSIVGLAICAAPTASLSGPLPTYTFEAPEFALGEGTPLLNEAPSSGPPTFLTSFTDSAGPNGYEVTGFDANPLIVGQALYSPSVPTALILTFNTPVNGLSVNFAINDPVTDPNGLLQLVTPSTTFDQLAGSVGGFYQGGILSFSASTPFTTATLQGFYEGGSNATQLEIDDLILTPVAVPEPSTLVLLGLGTTALVAWRRKQSMRFAA